MRYAGGESAHSQPPGRWRILCIFHWPDGRRDFHRTEPDDHTGAVMLSWAFAAGVPLVVVADGREIHVRVERALLVRMCDE